MDSCWISCQVMADMKKKLRWSHNYSPVPLCKVPTFWDGYKELKKKIKLRFEAAKCFQKEGDFFKLCGLLTISEL